MGNTPIPALAIRPPERPSDQITRLVQLRSLLGQQGLQQPAATQIPGELERVRAAQMQSQQLQQRAIRPNAYQSALMVGTNGTASIDNEKLLRNLAVAGHGAAIPAIMKNLQDYQKSLANLEETSRKVQALQQEMIGSLGAALKNASYDANLADLLIQEQLGQPNLPATTRLQLAQLQKALQANPAMVRSVADNLIAQSPKQTALAGRAMAAKARAKQANFATRRPGTNTAVAGGNRPKRQPRAPVGSPHSTGRPLNISLANGKRLVIP